MYRALEQEGNAEKQQLVTLHQQHVQKILNEKKRVAMQGYMDELQLDEPQVGELIITHSFTGKISQTMKVWSSFSMHYRRTAVYMQGFVCLHSVGITVSVIVSSRARCTASVFVFYLKTKIRR